MVIHVINGVVGNYSFIPIFMILHSEREIEIQQQQNTYKKFCIETGTPLRQRREIKWNTSTQKIKYRELYKTIKKGITKDIRNYNQKLVKFEIENQNAELILVLAFPYPSNHSKLILLSHVICQCSISRTSNLRSTNNISGSLSVYHIFSTHIGVLNSA